MIFFDYDELCHSDTAEKRGIKNEPTTEIVARLAELVETCLDPIRAIFGSGVRITSGYRCQTLNKAIGGSATSAHTTGYAADTQPMNGNMASYQKTVLAWARTAKFDQIIIEYPTNGLAKWIHIGVRNNKGQQRHQILVTHDGIHYLPYKG